MKLKNLSKLMAVVFIGALIVTWMTSTAFAQCVASNGSSGIQTQALYAGQAIDAGTVTVEVVGDNLEVTYTTTGGWELVETHLWVGDDLADMPQTRKGNPKVGNFPYQSGDITGATTYYFTVPLSMLDFFCPADDGNYFIAAHAALQKPDGSGGYLTETGWANGERIVEKGNWATYFSITLTCECDGGGSATCETTFAYAADPVGTCFFDGDEDGDNNGDFIRWGWSIGPLTEGTYTYDIYGGAGQCDTSKGTLVGFLTVEYSNGTATVTYTTTGGFTVDETQLYVGSEILPRDVNGDYTIAPGQYGNINDELNGVTSDTYTIGGLSDAIYVVAHGVVCGDYPQ